MPAYRFTTENHDLIIEAKSMAQAERCFVQHLGATIEPLSAAGVVQAVRDGAHIPEQIIPAAEPDPTQAE